MSDEPSLPPEERREFTLGVATTWVIGVFLFLGVCAMILNSISPDLIVDMVTTSTVFAAALFFVSALLLGAYPGGETLTQSLGLRVLPLWQVLVGFVAGVFMQAPARAVFGVVEKFFPMDPAEVAQRTEMLTARNLVHEIALLVVGALLVPFSEEAFFRGALFGALRRDRSSAFTAAMFTSVAFTLFHVEPRYWLPYIGIAIFLGALRAGTGSLLAPLAVHIGFNSVPLTRLGRSLESYAEPVRHQLIGTAVFVGLCGLFYLGCRGEGAKLRRAIDATPIGL